MNRDTYLRHISGIDHLRLEVARKKNMDYADEDNALKNFEQMQQICAALDIDVRRSAEDVAMFHTLHKMQRYANLMEGREPENEDVYDTLVDGHNYFDLAYLCKMEAKTALSE